MIAPNVPIYEVVESGKPGTQPVWHACTTDCERASKLFLSLKESIQIVFVKYRRVENRRVILELIAPAKVLPYQEPYFDRSSIDLPV